jgi:hypothetical protein
LNIWGLIIGILLIWYLECWGHDGGFCGWVIKCDSFGLTVLLFGELAFGKDDFLVEN